jgi:hypothetical protein
LHLPSGELRQPERILEDIISPKNPTKVFFIPISTRFWRDLPHLKKPGTWSMQYLPSQQKDHE